MEGVLFRRHGKNFVAPRAEHNLGRLVGFAESYIIQLKPTIVLVAQPQIASADAADRLRHTRRNGRPY